MSVAPAGAQTSPIKHVIIIMQENRSFDHYFGSFPGADGPPAGTCVPLDPRQPSLGCVVPFHTPLDVNAGGPHSEIDAQNDLSDGVATIKQDGYLLSQSKARKGTKKCLKNPNNPACAGDLLGILQHDAVSYHTDAEIPNYWAYAKAFVLQDHMFESERNWSLPSHLGLVSEWVAACKNDHDALTCATSAKPEKPSRTTTYPWANLFDLLDANKVDWRYYVGVGDEPDCPDGAITCDTAALSPINGSIWNPAPLFSSVQAKPDSYRDRHITGITRFMSDVTTGKLATVSWIVPSETVSEHPPAGVTAGMEYVTTLVNAVMASPYWSDTAIFVAWDDWGGFYDHVTPPTVDSNNSPTPVQGYGIRVPGLLISAYARAHMIDHATYSFDAYATLIENLFLSGKRLAPAALGNPDHRPTQRDSISVVSVLGAAPVPVGDLRSEFDFAQVPLPPLVLPTYMPTGITATCHKRAATQVCRSPNVLIGWDPVASTQVPGPFAYHVQRDGLDLPQCAGTATQCIDQPGPGIHLYRVNATGAQGFPSPMSAAAQIQQP